MNAGLEENNPTTDLKDPEGIFTHTVSLTRVTGSKPHVQGATSDEQGEPYGAKPRQLCRTLSWN